MLCKARGETLFRGILGIVFMRSLKQMVRPNALRDVAIVQQIFVRPKPFCKEPCDSMGRSRYPRTTVNLKTTVPFFYARSNPKPTIRGLVNKFPEALPEIFRFGHDGIIS